MGAPEPLNSKNDVERHIRENTIASARPARHFYA